VCSLPERTRLRRCRAGAGALIFVLACLLQPAHARELTLTIEDLEAPGFAARGLRATVSGPKLKSLELAIGELDLAGRTWGKVRLGCPDFRASGGSLACASGVLDLGEPMPMSFSYDAKRGELTAGLKPAHDEAWRIAAQVGRTPRSLHVTAENARLERFARWLPAELPKVSAGRARGTLALTDGTLKAEASFEGLAFSDAAGLRAGEKVGATLAVQGKSRDRGWAWDARLVWHAGEVFWQPVFLAAADQQLGIRASTVAGTTRVHDGRLEFPGIGTLVFTGEWNNEERQLRALDLHAPRIAAGPLQERLLQPVLQQTALADMRARGELALRAEVRGGKLQALELGLADIALEDAKGRFAAFGLTGRLPWKRGERSAGTVSLTRAELLRVPIGAMQVPLVLRDTRVDVAELRVPLLDGALILREFAAGLARDGWRWRFSGTLEPVSMSQLTRTLGLPLMHGTLAGAIPEVRYRRRSLEMDGALELKVFDGTVRATNVQLIDAFGVVPRLHAEVAATNLDLELLTRTFDFGTISGRVDAEVRALELVGWRPERFDARVASSPGRYPRRLSQRAIENISALGGPGAAAALQRTLLRFFDEFGYSRIGLSCRLENTVCVMDGIRPRGDGFVIIEGGGIPAVSVIGYNRLVDWPELIRRLGRITQEDLKPIIK
jgi:hypothetical protein